MRRRQCWARDRVQGYGPGLQVNATSAERPQGALVPGVAPISDALSRAWETIEAMPPPSEEMVPAPSDPAAFAAVFQKDACPKCGRPLKPRGKHLHIRACKGA